MSTASNATNESGEDAFHEWQKAVAGVLVKTRRVTRDAVPPDPEHLLDSVTYDGVTLFPLYGPRDQRDEPPLPGQFPYVRGRDTHRDVNAGWKVCAKFGIDARRGTAVNESVLDGLENGVSALWLHLGGANLPVQELPEALRGVLLDLVPLTLEAGEHTVAAAAEIFDVLDSRDGQSGATAHESVQIRLGAQPLTALFSGESTADVAATMVLARDASERGEDIRAITVNGVSFHNAGASDSQELGAATAAGIEYLRHLTAAGLSIEDALDQVEFRFAATDDQFHSIAKFRAGRLMWARVAQVCGAPRHGGAPQHGVTSEAMMTQRDPWVNMLRTTLAAFGAGIGGADSVTVLPFDDALHGGAADVSKNFAARIAKNSQLVLLEESHLGRVLDPAGGSWYVEELTQQLAERAWSFTQMIESAGGFASAIDSGLIAAEIDSVRATRDSDVAHRRKSITGVNEFPNINESPLTETQSRPKPSVRRYSGAHEALRNRADAFRVLHGHRPRVLLVPLGAVAEHNLRTTFASNLLASAGIEALDPGPVVIRTNSDEDTSAETVETVVKRSGASVAMICGTDDRYAELGAATVRCLRDAGIVTVLIAGPEAAFSEAGADDRPDRYVTAKVDTISMLSDLLTELEA